MTLVNGTPGAAHPGDERGPSGPRVRRAIPQSGVPTQAGPTPSGPLPSAPPFRPSGPLPMPPPGGPPAYRSPIVPSLRPDPEDDRTSLVERPEPGPGERWRKARAAVGNRRTLRYGLVGLLALAQAFVLFSAAMYWIGSSTGSASATVAPMTWTGVVYDVGAAGVNLRAAPQVRPDDARDTAARGARLALSCGQTGDVVAKGPVKTATWVKTADGLFVSMLYVHIPDRASIPSCDGSTVDGPLVALADPANPELPPPPGTKMSGSGSGQSTTSGSGVQAAPAPGAAATVPGSANPGAPSPASRAAAPTGNVASSGPVTASGGAAPVNLGPGTENSTHNHDSSSGDTTTTIQHAPRESSTASAPPNADTIPVG